MWQKFTRRTRPPTLKVTGHSNRRTCGRFAAAVVSESRAWPRPAEAQALPPRDLPLPGPVPDEPERDEEPEPEDASQPEEEPAAVTPEPESDGGDWEYGPMSEWGDDLRPSR